MKVVDLRLDRTRSRMVILNEVSPNIRSVIEITERNSMTENTYQIVMDLLRLLKNKSGNRFLKVSAYK